MSALWPPNSTFKKFANRNEHICLPKTCVNMCMCAYMTSRQSCPTLCDSMSVVHQTPLFMGFSRQNTRVGCCALLQGIFPTQGSNPHHLYLLLHWQAGFFFFLPLVPPGKPQYVYISTIDNSPKPDSNHIYPRRKQNNTYLWWGMIGQAQRGQGSDCRLLCFLILEKLCSVNENPSICSVMV